MQSHVYRIPYTLPALPQDIDPVMGQTSVACSHYRVSQARKLGPDGKTASYVTTAKWSGRRTTLQLLQLRLRSAQPSCSYGPTAPLTFFLLKNLTEEDCRKPWGNRIVVVATLCLHFFSLHIHKPQVECHIMFKSIFQVKPQSLQMPRAPGIIASVSFCILV